MIVNANTKIGALIKHKPEALDAIVSISPKFNKLRNPLLRKVIAGRTSIAMACKIGGCGLDDFFNKLKPLGLEIDYTAPIHAEQVELKQVPPFMDHIDPRNLVHLDVRPLIDAGKDPLTSILEKVKTLQTGQALQITNSFEPTPLMHLLSKQGFESYSEMIGDEHTETYFYKKTNTALDPADDASGHLQGWDDVLKRFNGKLERIDVRQLEMPLPMHTILEALQTLPAGKALFVYHKRIPVFLLPELSQQKFSYRIREIKDGEVHMLIYRD